MKKRKVNQLQKNQEKVKDSFNWLSIVLHVAVDTLPYF